MAHYTFPPGAAESVSGVTLPEYVAESGRAAYSFDDSTVEGIMFTIPELPAVSGDMNFTLIGYASGTSLSAVFDITTFDYSPSDAVAEGSFIAAASAWGNTSSLTMPVATNASYQLSQETLVYTPANTTTGDYFSFKVERNTADGNDGAVGDFRIVGVTLTF